MRSGLNSGPPVARSVTSILLHHITVTWADRACSSPGTPTAHLVRAAHLGGEHDQVARRVLLLGVGTGLDVQAGERRLSGRLQHIAMAWRDRPVMAVEGAYCVREVGRSPCGGDIVPEFIRGDVRIHYQEVGAGYPVLLFAPGLMRSSAAAWERSDIKPVPTLERDFRLIVMDQRNAGGSHAPIAATDGWADYADDAIGLVDHLGLTSLAVWGRCIGPSFCLKFIQQLGANAGRVSAFVDHAPIGLTDINRGHYMHGFYQWAEELPAGSFPGPVGMDETAASFCENLFGSDFVFSVSRDFASSLQTPTLVLPGRDLAHPEAVALETAELAPRAELELGWQERLPETAERIRSFLHAHAAH